ncbi:MAG: 3-oxoacyl-[acyl-carrier-protein] reductase [Lentisphaerales bacterium]|nr:MAG: 3-oxoacyl-[acyl-carrier-protein] reductase [Lentisphaerales bacterium]
MCDLSNKRNSYSLSGKTALVTGAGRGIGQAISVVLAGAGADLALCDLEKSWLDETAELVRGAGRRAECFAMNVADWQSVSSGVESVIGTMGRIDVLVNNAGITKDSLLVRMTEEAWDEVLSVNLKGTFAVTRAVAKHMMKQKSGAIVNIASIIGLIGNFGQCNYAASKGGVIAFTKSAARELASRNVRVNEIAPGFIETRMTGQLTEDVRSRMLEAIPMKKFGTPQNVAEVVLFLACEASAYMTGQVLTVSGGMVM